ncbi:MAG: DUF2971 domain-containing protein [Verrucomicrobia bacterium]|nr:DUF2971 domain-containing protein [Verrucomicrobiota bacterium]
MALFKYLPPERVDNLEKERIAITPPDRFNDAFELRPRVPSPSPNYLEKAVKEASEQERQESPDLFRGVDSGLVSEVEKDLIKGIVSGAVPYADHFQDSLQSESSKHFGILCLSAVNNQELMWGLYANGHRGFVIEFDCNQSAFRQLGKPWKVEYSEKPPIYDLEKPSDEFWRVKHTRWQHEAEYRIIRPLPACKPETQEDRQVVYFCDLPRTCVKAVYFGHRIAPEIRNRILKVVVGPATSKFDAILDREDCVVSFKEITDGAAIR